MLLYSQKAVNFGTIKQRMWEKYFKYCSSDELKEAWAIFLRGSVGLESSPIFYQYIMKNIMNKAIREVFSEQNDDSKDKTIQDLGYEESKALWYVAGYVVCS